MSKILQIGTSLGVTLPKSVLKQLGLKKGSAVEVALNKRRRSIEISPISSGGSSTLIEEISKIVEANYDDLRRIEDEW